MVTLRPTQKLRSLLPLSAGPGVPSDTALGDGYVSRLIVDRRPLLLLVSASSLLPIVIPARDVGSLPSRLGPRTPRAEADNREFFSQCSAFLDL